MVWVGVWVVAAIVVWVGVVVMGMVGVGIGVTVAVAVVVVAAFGIVVVMGCRVGVGGELDVSDLSDRATVKALRQRMDLRDVLRQLRHDGWSPQRAAAALELPESMVLRVLVGPPRRGHQADARVRALAAELDDRRDLADALHGLVVESRGGLWPVQWWPVSHTLIAMACRRRLASMASDALWEPTKLGVSVDIFRQSRKQHAL